MSQEWLYGCTGYGIRTGNLIPVFWDSMSLVSVSRDTWDRLSVRSVD